MSATIIHFPKSKVIRTVPNEQLLKGKEVNLKGNIEVIVDEIGTELMLHLEHYGIDVVDEEKNHRDMLFVYDILRAVLYRNAGMPHHLHEFLNKSLTMKPLADLLPKEFPDDFINTGGEGLDQEAEKAIREIIKSIEDHENEMSMYDDLPSDVEPEPETT